MSIDLLEDVAPASKDLGAIAEVAEKMEHTSERIAQLEQAIKAEKQNLRKLSEEDLPDIMQALNMKSFTLSNGAHVEVTDVISGSIPSQGAIDKSKDDDRGMLEMRQQGCFDWLRHNGGGDIIKNNVEVQFSKEEDQECNTFVSKLRESEMAFKRATGVHPKQLNKFLAETIATGKEVPHDLFKIYSGRKATIRRK